jgi:hypothetical protein
VAFVRARAYWILDYYDCESDFSDAALLSTLVQVSEEHVDIGQSCSDSL